MIKYKGNYKFTRLGRMRAIKFHGNILLALRKFGNPGITVNDW